MESRLRLDPAMVAEARDLARTAGRPIVELARTHSTVSVERAVLRLGGLDGADGDGMPWVNRLVDAVRESTGLEHGVALPAWDALACGYPTLAALARDAAQGAVKFRVPEGADATAARDAAGAALAAGFATIDRRRRAHRDDRGHGRAAAAVDLPDRGHWGHLRGHSAGAGGGAGGRGRHRGDPVHRPVAA
jgi:beta-lysine 5,6-aminomutase alpha subunit